MMNKITFPERDASLFMEELKQRVSEYWNKKGISDKANALMIGKTAVVLALTFGSYGLLLTNRFSLWEMLGLAILMGVGMAGIGFSIAHDALHGAYSSNAAVNKVLGLFFDLVGANGYMWKLTHNIIHHTYTNIRGIDEDLEVSPLLRLSPHSRRRWFHRFQHWYAFLAYALATLNWVFVKDFQYFLRRDLGPFKNIKHPKPEVATLIVMKAVYYTWTIVVPWLVLDVTWWQFLIGLLAMHITAGFILGIVFQLAHVVEGTDHPLPDVEGKMDQAWIIHEMQTTSDFGRRNRLLSWYVGGLNFQIEHHLFPRVCSVHYPAISRIVEEAAVRHGVRFNQHRTMREAVASHYRVLKKLGKRPSVIHNQ
jgi:linoleoyl-CoA desaturase